MLAGGQRRHVQRQPVICLRPPHTERHLPRPAPPAPRVVGRDTGIKGVRFPCDWPGYPIRGLRPARWIPEPAPRRGMERSSLDLAFQTGLALQRLAAMSWSSCATCFPNSARWSSRSGLPPVPTPPAAGLRFASGLLWRPRVDLALGGPETATPAAENRRAATTTPADCSAAPNWART